MHARNFGTRAAAALTIAVALTMTSLASGGAVSASNPQQNNAIASITSAAATLNPLAPTSADAATYKRCSPRGVPIKWGFCVQPTGWAKGRTYWNGPAGKHYTDWYEEAKGFWNGIPTGYLRTGEWKSIPAGKRP